MDAQYKAVIALLLLFHVLYPATVAEVVGRYIEPQESYSIEKISVGGKDYWIVKVNNEETFIVDYNSNIIWEKESLRNVLTSYSREKADFENKRKYIQSSISIFNESQYPERRDCERITGVDKMECLDKESCIKACYAVPLCAMQIRDKLIDSILDWNNQRKAVDEKIIDAKNKVSTLETKQDFDNAKTAIRSMIDEMRKLEGMDIYNVDRYCGNMSIDYNTAEKAEEYAQEIASMFGSERIVIARADSIYSKAIGRKEYIETRDETYAKIYANLSTRYDEVEKMYSNAMFTDNETEGLLIGLENCTAIMRGLKSEGKYKVAIDTGSECLNELAGIKTRLQTYIAQYDIMESKGKNVLAMIEKAKPKVYNTSYENDLVDLEREIKLILKEKVQRSKINEYSKRVSEIESEVNTIVARAVLEEETNASGTGQNAEVVGKKEGVMTYICSIINAIESFLGISLGVCS
ncbi:MAG: hypothetical protein ACP5KJ_02545 [Candidatus Micrarchaeia archaeon]